MDIPFWISYSKYLNPFTLTLRLKKDADLYKNSVEFYKSIFFRLSFAWIFLIIVLLFIFQNNIFGKPILLSIAIIVLLFSIGVLCLIPKLIKNNLLIDFLLTIFALTPNVIIIEVSIPLWLHNLGWKENEPMLLKKEIVYFLVYVGVHIHIFMNLLHSAKVNWIFVSLHNIIVNFLLFRHFISLYQINGEGGYLMTITLPTSFLVMIISYFDEKAYKKILIHLNRVYENIVSFEKIIDNLPNQIIILNAENLSLKFMNSKTKDFFNIPNDANSTAMSEILLSIKHSEDQNLDLKEICKNNLNFIGQDKKGEFINFNAVYARDTNKPAFFDIKIEKISWRNEGVLLIIMNDISQNIQFLKELNEYKDLLLASVSHDLRTPLNCIMGILEMLNEEIKNSELLKYIYTAQCSSKMLLSLINDILDYSQISNNKLKLNIEYFEFNQLIDELSNMFFYQAKKKNIKFQTHLPSFLKNKKIFGDKRRLEQILINLIGNALKFTLKGEVTLSISAKKCLLHDENVITFTVTDTGIGIEKDHLNEIFSIFKKIEQEDPNINRAGVGLGLFLSQNIAKIMHEEGITVESKKNIGSKFSFSLPVEDQDHSQTDDMLEHKINYPRNSNDPSIIYCFNDIGNDFCFFKSKKLYVLFVDDDVFNILIHQKYADYLGIEYEVAYNGAEALEKIEECIVSKKYFSLVFLDCNMPILNGFETAKKINNLIRQKLIPNMPIIALTANVTSNDVNHCLESGMQYYLAKPVSKNAFKEKILEAIKNYC